MKIKKLLSAFFLFVGILTYSQIIISGKVVNGDTGQNIESAIIYLDDKIIAETDSIGEFRISINSIADNKILLVEFEKNDNYYKKEVSINENNRENLNIELKKEDIEPYDPEKLITGKIIYKETGGEIEGALIFLGNEISESDSEGIFQLTPDNEIRKLIIEFNMDSVSLRKIVTIPRNNKDLLIELSNNDQEKDEKDEKDGQNTENEQITIGDVDGDVDDDEIMKDIVEEKAVVIYANKKKNGKIKKGDPIRELMAKVWARKRSNGLQTFKTYEYDQYEKIRWDLNNIDDKFAKTPIIRQFKDAFQKVDTLSSTGKPFLPLFLTESYYKIYGTNNPKKEKENLIAIKTAGGNLPFLQDNDALVNTVKNLYKDFNIYENTLNFFNKGFTSPVARNCFDVYTYQINDTIDYNGVKSIWLSYKPLRENELTFYGDLYISLDSYAVINVSLISSGKVNVNFVRGIFTEIDYQMLNDSIFLPKKTHTQLDLSLFSKKDNAKGLYANRTIEFKNYDFNSSEVTKKVDEYWDYSKAGSNENQLKLDEIRSGLTAEDSLANEIVNSNATKIKKIIKVVDIISSGYISVDSLIDVGNIYSMIGYNSIEGFRLKGSARTYFSKNDPWRIEGFGAYGFRDDKFKYGVEARFLLDKKSRLIIGAGTRRDIMQLGANLVTTGGVMDLSSLASSSMFSRGDNNLLSNVNKTNLFTSIEPWKNIRFRLEGGHQSIRSADTEKFDISYLNDNNEVKDRIYDSYVSLNIVARPGAKYSRYGVDRYEHTTLAPTITLKYTKGFDGIIGSSFNYDKLQFSYSHPILWGAIGMTNIGLSAGRIFNKVPISLLSIIPANQSYATQYGSFELLNYYDFVTDQYIMMNMEHHFDGRILSYIPLIKKLNLRELIFVRGVTGDISDGSKSMNKSSINYSAPKDHIYYEYGFGIENIGISNFRFIRIDFNWRGNYFDLPDSDTFGIKLGMQFKF